MVNIRLVLLALFCFGITSTSAHAIDLRISSQALERTLQNQLFNSSDGRYYLRGDRKSACYVYADQPKVSFRDDRVVVSVHTTSRLGTGIFGKCVGLGFTTVADVSIIPQAEEETIGFRDARIEHFTGNRELDFLLVPFLSRKLPQQMTVNAADMLRSLLVNSTKTTGYEMKLDQLRVHSMVVHQQMLDVDMDGTLSVR